MRMSKFAWGIVAAVLLAAAPAWAEEDKGAPNPCGDAKADVKVDAKVKVKKKKPPKAEETPAEPASDEASAEVKAGTGINRKKREIVGEADNFDAGIKVWVWSRINGAKGSQLVHVWKRDDKKLMGKEFTAKSNRYRTWSALRVKAGSYTVEVQDEAGTVLGSVSFTVGGEATAAKAE